MEWRGNLDLALDLFPSDKRGAEARKSATVDEAVQTRALIYFHDIDSFVWLCLDC